jgi:putative membrane protein
MAPQYDLISLFGPAVALVAIAGFWVLSGLLQVLRYYGFTLTRRGEELRYARGLLQRYNGTIPLSKVQAVSLQENVLARAVGYGSLVIRTAGRAGGDGQTVESAVPIAKRDRALALAREVEPVGEISFQRPPKRARTRYAIRYAIAVLVFVGLLRAGEAATGLVPLLYLPLAGLLAVPVAAHLAWVHRGYHVDEEYVVTRRGFWRRRTMIVPADRVQTVFTTQTLFQRRRRLGSVTVDTAGGGGLGAGDAVAVDIDATEAERLRERVAGNLQRALTR